MLRRVLLGFLALLLALLVLLPVVLVGVRPRRPPPTAGYPITVAVLQEDTGRVVELPLEEYVKGVVAAEMPAAFHPEALKAQAVLARTYVVRRLRLFGGDGVADGSADISSHPAQGQAWLDQRALREKWGLLGYYRYWGKVCEAVEATSGQILTYQGEIADGLYHSTCGGHTESAAEVWGQAVPYLTGVPCEFCRHSPRYHTQVYIPLRALPLAIPSSTTSVGASVSAGAALTLLESTVSGRVRSLRVGETVLRGTDARARLDLPSTWFSWKVEGDQVRFDVRGSGHGVGMCQYGADGQARQGRTYLEILQYYFPGTAVSLIFSE
ncbi:MAG: stage II sporulation protein D [Bacillota bacterium]|nr:stage II sporulation protein D [Bacillota bacterium]